MEVYFEKQHFSQKPFNKASIVVGGFPLTLTLHRLKLQRETVPEGKRSVSNKLLFIAKKVLYKCEALYAKYECTV